MDEKKTVYRRPWAVTKADAGNWEIREDPEEFGEGDFRIIADLVPDATEEEARLMVAAPKLLEACKLAVDELGCIGADGEPCRTCKTLQKAIAAATEAAETAVHDVPKEEMPDWQWTRDHVRHKRILYVLIEDDAQDVAQQKFGRELTEYELYQVKKSVEWGFSESWTDIMEQAVCDAADHD